MSAVVGIDLSTKAIDLVKLQEDSNRAEWHRIELKGATAWERTLSVRGPMPLAPGEPSWWDDVYLVAIEAPMGHGSNKLDRVVGAIAASLPAHLRDPSRCWIVPPQEWKSGLGLKRKPTEEDIARLGGAHVRVVEYSGSLPNCWTDEHFRDAYALAWWARNENAKGVAA